MKIRTPLMAPRLAMAQKPASLSEVALQAVVAGSLASLLSTAALLLLGHRQSGSAVAPINAVSHWLWGDEALHRDAPDARHTALGYVTHHASSILWALVQATAMRKPRLLSDSSIVAGSIATSALACLVDYQVVPKRVTPGFEHRLSTGAMFGVYAAVALGLAAGALAVREQRR